MIAVNLHLRHRPKVLSVELHEPEPDEDCPILQEPIHKGVLDCLPRPFYADHPTHTAIALPCRHKFHAMALIYHWARSGNVLCPVCRSGPAGEQLVVGRLPKEWKYSLQARIRRLRRQDKLEEEETNRRLAVEITQATPPSLELFLRIESDAGIAVVRTVALPRIDCVVFDVPPEELARIPFPEGARMRLVPFTHTRLFRASDWFVSAIDSGDGFSTLRTEHGFQHMQFVVPEDTFAVLLADVFLRGTPIFFVHIQ
jgi:hypothetical protein